MSAPLTVNVRRALKRIPVLLAEDIAATDADLCEELGLTNADVRTVIAILYRQRRVDRIGAYIVLPASHGPLFRESEAA